MKTENPKQQRISVILNCIWQMKCALDAQTEIKCSFLSENVQDSFEQRFIA